MKKLIKVSVVSLAIIASPAMAQGFFVEGTLGQSKVDVGNTGSWTANNKDTSYGLSAGYMVNDYFGVEAGYRDLGKASLSATGTFSGSVYGRSYTVTNPSYSASATGWEVGPRVRFPINDQFSLTGRAGWFSWTAKETFSATALTVGGTA